MRTHITATHSRPVQYSQDHAYRQEAPTPPPIPSSPRGRGLVEPYRPLGPLPPRTVRAVARLGPHPVADDHLVDVAALAAPPCELAAYGLHAGGLQAPVHARVHTGTDQTKTCVKTRHLQRKRTPLATSGGFAGRTSPKRHNTPAFPQIGEVDSERHLPKTPEVAGARQRTRPRQPQAPTRAQ